SQYRQDALGAPFAMFDFAPVGLAVAAVGVAFTALIGWRLLPLSRLQAPVEGDDGAAFYIAELAVGPVEEGDERRPSAFDPIAEETDVNVLGLIRDGRRLTGFSRLEPIREGDVVVVEGEPKSIEAFMGKARLGFAGAERHEGGLAEGALSLIEAIVPQDAPLQGCTALGLGLLGRFDVALLGVSRGRERFRKRVRELPIRAGDVVLLLGTPQRLAAAVAHLGVLPLEGRRTDVLQRHKARLAAGLIFAAILAAVSGFAALPVALAACVVAYVATGLLSGREVYAAVDWKVIVLLASLIPLGEAFEASGGAQLIADQVVAATSGLPPWAVLLTLMVLTMTLSDFLNNVATALLAAPIGVEVARALSLSPDPFLMGVAVAASCAFLTPIGHKNNTIVMGPGGYRFQDYWRMGLPLELIVLAVALPTILWVWPMTS
ncbi:MAG: SLC13 family permease, partial [Pseudomonadota bacterium]